MGIAAATPSYDMYVRSWTSSAAAVPYGAALQLPVLCQGASTTLSFQPQLAKDSLGRTGAVADTWRHFVAGSTSQWSTSRSVAGFDAGSVHTLGDYATACNAAGDGAVGVMAGVGGLGSAGQSLDTYVDNLAVNSTVYEFSVGSTSAAKVAMAATAPAQDRRDPGQRLGHLHQPGGRRRVHLGRHEAAVHQGQRPQGRRPDSDRRRTPVTLTADPAGTLSGVVVPPTSADLGPGGSYRTAFTVAFKARTPPPSP